jgi:hypothetical protein
VLLEGVVEEAPPELIPEGEKLICMREAADLLGYRSTGAAAAFASKHGALFKIGGRRKVSPSLLRAGLRAAQVVEEPALAPEAAP